MSKEMRKQMDKFKKILTENSAEKYKSITVKMTDKWLKTNDIYHKPNTIELRNDDEKYSYIGNTRLDSFSGVIYFASRKGNLIFITGLDFEGAERRGNIDVGSLTDGYPKSKYELEGTGLRKFPQATCTLGPDPDYKGELEIGMKDHRGYFEIVAIK